MNQGSKTGDRKTSDDTTVQATEDRSQALPLITNGKDRGVSPKPPCQIMLLDADLSRESVPKGLREWVFGAVRKPPLGFISCE